MKVSQVNYGDFQCLGGVSIGAKGRQLRRIPRRVRGTSLAALWLIAVVGSFVPVALPKEYADKPRAAVDDPLG